MEVKPTVSYAIAAGAKEYAVALLEVKQLTITPEMLKTCAKYVRKEGTT